MDVYYVFLYLVCKGCVLVTLTEKVWIVNIFAIKIKKNQITMLTNGINKTLNAIIDTFIR